MYTLLDGYDLAGYLDGTTLPPPATVTNNGVTTHDPAYTLWKRQDKLIYNGLLSEISMTIQPFNRFCPDLQLRLAFGGL